MRFGVSGINVVLNDAADHIFGVVDNILSVNRILRTVNCNERMVC